MKNLGYLLSFLLLCSFQPMQEKETGWENDGLKGKVKQFKQRLFFPQAEYATEAVTDWANGSSFDYKDYTKNYNEKGQLIEELNYDEESEKVDMRVRYIYDKAGNLFETRTYFENDQFFQKAVYKYDESGRQLEELYFTAEDSFTVNTSITWKYGEHEAIRTIAHKKDTAKTRVISKLDDQGNKIENRWYDSNGKVSQKSAYKFDDKKRPVEIFSYIGESLSSRYYYKYNEQGDLVEWTWYHPPNYDQGKLHYKRTWKYEYDAQGNWITKTESDNDVYKCIAKRDIVYFE